MKKILSLILICVSVLAFAACGKEETVDTYAAAYGSKGTIVDTGVIKAVCPSGWNSVDAFDITASADETASNAIIFVKGGTSVSEDKPYIRIEYYGEEEEVKFPSSSDYDNSQDAGSVYIGSNTWTGFTASVNNHSFACLKTADSSGGTFVAYLWMHTGEEVQSSINDDDVKLILQSAAVDVN